MVIDDEGLLRERLVSSVEVELVPDVDRVAALIRGRVGRRRHRRRLTTATVAVVAGIVAVTMVVVVGDDRGPRVATGAGGDHLIDAELLWIDATTGPVVGDPNSGQVTPIGPVQDLPWCAACPSIRVGDSAFTAQRGRILTYEPDVGTFSDIGAGRAVFPTADGEGLLVAIGDELERWNADGTRVEGPWAIPDGYRLPDAPRAISSGILLEQSANELTRDLVSWDPMSGVLSKIGTDNRVIDTYTNPHRSVSKIAETSCASGNSPCWLLITDTITSTTLRVDSPVPGSGFYAGGAFSPDGSELAAFIATNEGTSNPAARLGIVDVDTGALRLIEGSDVSVGEPYGYASWSPSGAWLFFDGLTGNVRALERGGDQARELHLAGGYSLVALPSPGPPSLATTAPAGSTTTSASIDTEAVARDQITEALLGAFGGGGSLSAEEAIAGGVPLDADAKQAAKQRNAILVGAIVPRVNWIDFDSPTRAIVNFDLLKDGQLVTANTTGEATFVDGYWRITSETFCTVARRASVKCPDR
jgi:hypothetical protein